MVQQLASVSAQLGPDLADLARFEAETPKIAPGDYLQMSAVVNVLLPPGGSEATALTGDRLGLRGGAALGGAPGPGFYAPFPTCWRRACHEVPPVNKRLAPRLIALAIVVVLGVYYIAIDVMQYRLGSQPFPVTVLMRSAGGLYTGADVTYRGVQVGTVSAVDLRPSHVAAVLAISPGQHIPDNGAVQVKELSALGEQYIDLQPARSSGPDLRSGSVIPATRVVLPTPIGTDADRPGVDAHEHQPAARSRPTRASSPPRSPARGPTFALSS